MTVRSFPSESRIFWTVVILAASIKLALALRTFGTNDVLFFQGYADKVKLNDTLGLYRDGVVVSSPDVPAHSEFFAHPPFIIHVLDFLNWVRSSTGLPFPFLFRLLSILADVGSAVMVRKLLKTATTHPHPHIAACLFAGAPLMILLSGFHGNTDPVMIFFLIACVLVLSRPRAKGIGGVSVAWIAGVLFGMSCNIKIWPVILGPILALSLSDFRQRFAFSATAFLTFIVGGLPVLADDPQMVASHVFFYPSLFGHWGFSRVLVLTGPQSLFLFYGQHGRMITSTAILAGTILLHWKSRAHLVLKVGLLVSLFLVITPGFGIQYLSWLLPWLVFLPLEAMLIYQVCTAVFMFQVYTFWSNGFPWNLADSLARGTWRDFLVWHELLCWLSVVFCFSLFLRQTSVIASLRSILALPAQTDRQTVGVANTRQAQGVRRLALTGIYKA